jgi:hypothetical protein
VIDFIFFLGQVPWGLCSADLSHLVLLESGMFGNNKEFFLEVQSLSLSKEMGKVGEMFSYLQRSQSDPGKLSEAFLCFL